MSKRSDVLAWLRIAGYHGDEKKRIELYIVPRIAFKFKQDAWYEGVMLRKNHSF